MKLFIQALVISGSIVMLANLGTARAEDSVRMGEGQSKACPATLSNTDNRKNVGAPELNDNNGKKSNAQSAEGRVTVKPEHDPEK